MPCLPQNGDGRAAVYAICHYAESGGRKSKATFGGHLYRTPRGRWSKGCGLALVSHFRSDVSDAVALWGRGRFAFRKIQK
jgi:hypothetical protein